MNRHTLHYGTKPDHSGTLIGQLDYEIHGGLFHVIGQLASIDHQRHYVIGQSADAFCYPAYLIGQSISVDTSQPPRHCFHPTPSCFINQYDICLTCVFP